MKIIRYKYEHWFIKELHADYINARTSAINWQYNNNLKQFNWLMNVGKEKDEEVANRQAIRFN